MLLILLAFLGGVLTVLSPCVLPVLPILLSGSVGGSSRPLGIITGFIGSFVFITLFLASIVSALGISADSIRWVAVVLLFGFGLILAVPAIHTQFELLMSRNLPQQSNSDQGGFVGGVLLGATLGVIWTPCVGPILASVQTLALSSEVNAFAAVVTLAYAIGVAIPMFGVMLGGRKFLHRPALMNRLTSIQQTFGVILVLFAVGMVFGVDRMAQTFLVEQLPFLENLTFLEENASVQEQINQRLP